VPVPTVCPHPSRTPRRAGRTAGNLRGGPAVGRLVTPADRAALLAELEACATPAVVGAHAILDDLELGPRVAETFAAAETA